jgi:hypothetical protein
LPRPPPNEVEEFPFHPLKERWRSRFDALKQRFVLTREEKRVIIFIVVAFALGLTARHYRGAHSPIPDKIDNKHSYSRAQGASPSSTPSRKNARMSSPKKNVEPTAFPNMNRVLTDKR